MKNLSVPRKTTTSTNRGSSSQCRLRRQIASRGYTISMLVAIHQNAYYFQPYGNNHTDVYDLNREKGTQLYRKNTCSETIRMLQIYTLTRPSDAVGGFVLHTRHCIIRCKHFNSLLRIPTMAQAFLRRERTGVLRFKRSEMVLQRWCTHAARLGCNPLAMFGEKIRLKTIWHRPMSRKL